MKTTIDLPDSLLEEAKRVAARRSTTVKALVESGLRKELRARSERATFRLRDASYRGHGLRPEAQGLSWEAQRELAYGERGG
jgi:hypothetical protein